VAQPKNCPFGVNTTIELQNTKIKSDNNGIYRDMFQLTSVPVFSEGVVTFSSSSQY